MCVAMFLLIGIPLGALAYLSTIEDAPSTAEEVEFPVVSGSRPAGEDVPVPLAEMPTTSTMPAPVATTTPRTAPMMSPTAPTAPPAEPPAAPTMPPPAPTMSPTAPMMRPTEPTAPSAEPPTAPTVTVAEPSVSVFMPDEATDKQPMVCTMSDRITSSLQFPPDGLCDYIFFDSLYKEGRNLLTNPATYSNSLGTFLIDHGAYRHTNLGVGFAFNYLATADEDLKVRNPSPLAPFWKEGIFHVGILDTPASAVRIETRAAIATLKAINQLLDTRRNRGNFSITALAAPYPDLDWSVAFAKDFKDLRFTPYLFITFGHYRFGDNTVTHCAVMPPTRHPDDAPPDDIARDYKFDLSTAVFSLRELYAKGTNTRGVVSVTLKGRWTEPLFPDIVDFFMRCSSDPDIVSFGSYTEVCPGGGSGFGARLNYSKTHYAVITYIESIRRTFVYDDEKAFAAKLCKAKALDSDVTFGIAVYDIDYDDYENKCSSLNRYNRNSRLKAVKRVVESFRRQSLFFYENICRKAAP